MNPLPLKVRDDPFYKDGGVVALVVPAAAGRATDPVEVIIAQDDPTAPFLGALGWQATEYRWRSGPVRDEGTDLIIPLGDRVAGRIDEYTPLRIVVPALGLEGNLVWQGITPSSRSPDQVTNPGGRVGASFSKDPIEGDLKAQTPRGQAPAVPTSVDEAARRSAEAERIRLEQQARAKAEAERAGLEVAERARAEQETRARAQAAAEAERASREAAERARAEKEVRAKAQAAADAQQTAREAAEFARSEQDARAKAEVQRLATAHPNEAAPARTSIVTHPSSGSRRTTIIALISVVLVVLGLSAAWLFKRHAEAPTPPTPKSSPQSPNAVAAGDWILVPGGQSVFGEAGNLESLPQFLIQKHEVTNAEYALFVQKCPVGSTCGPSGLPSYWDDASFMRARSQHPVVEVTWDDAQAYARFIGGRLPSSKEWEKAARYPNARRFPWGPDEDKSRANILGAEGHGEVKSALRGIPTWAIDDPRYERDASSLGVLGLAGNVSEWTSSHSEKQASLIFSAGGSWDSWQFSDAQTFVRNSIPPNSRSSSLGFRCAKDHL